MKILEEEPPLADECKLPWLIDAFLYPISTSGLIHIAIFVFVPRVVSFVLGLMMALLVPIFRQGTGYILAFLLIPYYLFFYGYVFYYITDCVVSSSKGDRRASDVTVPNNLSAGDFVSQVILILGCIAICLWPAAVYYSCTRQTDLYFFLLFAGGVFFLPMSFLRGVMFDCFDALNPISITSSILSTFLSYCGLVLFFFALGGFVAVILPRLPLWGFVSASVKIYLLFVLIHRLGWFYWWHKDKLDWGI